MRTLTVSRSTLAETLLGIETEDLALIHQCRACSTLAETLLGIETPQMPSNAMKFVVPLWLKPF